MTSVTDQTRAWAERRGIPHTFTTTTGSTNDDAKRADVDEHLFLTAHQTAGRGRGTNQWIDSSPGAILLSTWCLHAVAAPGAITGPRVGLALHQAVSTAWPSLKFGLKAPNDLYLGTRKLAGLLIESVSVGARARVLIGLGLNAFAHPGDLGTATDLTVGLGRRPNEAEWSCFLDAWLDRLRAAVVECVRPELNPAARRDLRLALNANGARTFDVLDGSPAGDLVHAGGVVRWTEL